MWKVKTGSSAVAIKKKLPEITDLKLKTIFLCLDVSQAFT